MNILVVGGSRFMGPRLVRILQERGHRLTVFNRGRHGPPPAGVAFIQGDRERGFGITDRFDVVVDTCAYHGRHVETALDELDPGFYVHIGTAASYEEPARYPLTEEMPIGDWPCWGDYNRGKVEAERALRRSGRRSAVVRPVYMLGPGNHLRSERYVYSRIRDGRALVLPGDGKAVAQFVFADEVAMAVARIAEGRVEGVFNCAGDDALSLESLVREMGRIVGKEPRIELAASKGEAAPAAGEEFPFLGVSFCCSNAKIKGLGLAFRPLVAGLRADWDGHYKDLS